MNIIHFVIVALLLVQFSIKAQNTGQVTLSIILYPIQTIEVTPSNVQVLELFDQNISTPSLSSQLSTFSTSQFSTKIDSVNSSAFQKLRASSAVPPRSNRSINRIEDTERYDRESGGDGLHVVYSMETL